MFKKITKICLAIVLTGGLSGAPASADTDGWQSNPDNWKADCALTAACRPPGHTKCRGSKPCERFPPGLQRAADDDGYIPRPVRPRQAIPPVITTPIPPASVLMLATLLLLSLFSLGRHSQRP